MMSKIFIISGPSGSGKSSVSAPLRDRDDCIFSISYTTRKCIRPGEIKGKDYNFVTDKEFDRAIQNNEFLEWEQVFENRYGTKREDFDRLAESGKNVIAILDVKGAMNIKKLYPDVVTVFILPPNPKEAAGRLQNRGTENKASRAIRQARFSLELGYKDLYDHTIINGDLKTAQHKLIDIVMGLKK